MLREIRVLLAMFSTWSRTKNNKHSTTRWAKGKNKTAERIAYVCIENIWLNVSAERTASFIDSDWIVAVVLMNPKATPTKCEERRQTAQKRASNKHCLFGSRVCEKYRQRTHYRVVIHVSPSQCVSLYLSLCAWVRRGRHEKNGGSGINDAIYLLFHLLLLQFCSYLINAKMQRNLLYFATHGSAMMLNRLSWRTRVKTLECVCVCVRAENVLLYRLTFRVRLCVWERVWCQCVALLVRWSHRHRKIP